MMLRFPTAVIEQAISAFVRGNARHCVKTEEKSQKNRVLTTSKDEAKFDNIFEG